MNLPKPFERIVAQCQVCGKSHKLTWRPFTHPEPLRRGIVFWSTCPTADEPTFLVSSLDPPGSEYGLWSVNDQLWLGTDGAIFHTTSREMAEEQRRGMQRGPLIRTWEIRRFGDAYEQAPPAIVGIDGEVPS